MKIRAVHLLLYVTLKLQSCASVDVTGCPVGIRITVVCNALIWPDQDWALLIRSQLDQLEETGIVECASIHVALSIPAFHNNMTYEALEEELEKGRRLVQQSLPPERHGLSKSVVITQVHENAHEYPGLHLLWLLAQEIMPEHAARNVFLYFHTKGMVNHGRHTVRPEIEAKLFNSTIVPWRDITDIFARNATVTRCGTFPSPGGWVWFNFWWARASYIQGVVEPIRTSRRHYYEDWLGRLMDATTNDNPEPGRIENCDTCYSINDLCSGHGILYMPGKTLFCADRA